MATEPYRFTATEALKAFDDGTLTVEDYAKSVIKRIQERDSVVKAWAYFNADQVLEQARALDKVPKDQRGPLHGVGIAVKDVIYTKGMLFLPESP
jgi:amidase